MALDNEHSITSSWGIHFHIMGRGYMVQFTRTSLWHVQSKGYQLLPINESCQKQLAAFKIKS